MPGPQIYYSSFKYAFVDRIFIVSFASFVICLCLAIFMQDFDPGLLGVLLILGSISLTFVLKYWLTAISSVSIDSDGIVFTYRRNGEDESFHWHDFDLIGERFSSWLFESKDGRKLVLLERYYSDENWCNLSAQIRRCRSSQGAQEISGGKIGRISQEIVFKPRYEKKYLWIAVFGILTGVLGGLGVSPSPRHHPIEGLIIGIAITCFSIYLLFGVPRRVRLNGQIIVQRYFLPRKKIFYHEITDITSSAIHTRKGRILLAFMLNDYILHAIVSKKMEEGRMHSYQFTGNRGAIKWSDAKAALLASVVTPMVITCLYYFFENLRPWRFPLLLWLGVFLLTYYVISLVLNKRTDSEGDAV